MHPSSDIQNQANPEPKALRRFNNWMSRVRPKEVINGGHFVATRREVSGRISMSVRPFEHPTKEAACAEALRLSQLPENHGKTFEVISGTVVIRNGEVFDRVS